MNANLVIGLFWLLLSSIFVFFEDNNWIGYGYLLVAVLYLGTYVYQKRHGYFTLDDGLLRINDLRKKQIDLNKVNRFKDFAGDYILEAENQKIKINTGLLDPPNILLLKEELAKYNLKPGFKRAVQVHTN